MITSEEIETDFSKVNEILVPSKVLEKIFTYARAVDSEIGGLMVVDESGEKPLIKDCLLSKQKANSSEMELDPDAIAEMLESAIKKKNINIEQISGWWHSHSNFETFWSGQDDDCFDCISNTSPIVYGIVINKSGDMLGRIDIKTRIGTIKVNNVKITPFYGKDKGKFVKDAKNCIIPQKECFTVNSFYNESPIRYLSDTTKVHKADEYLDEDYPDDYMYGRWSRG
jgi:proteasome lid subunit RPN8/RPN11